MASDQDTFSCMNNVKLRIFNDKVERLFLITFVSNYVVVDESHNCDFDFIYHNIKIKLYDFFYDNIKESDSHDRIFI